MATINVNIPQNFFSNMRQFMATVQRMNLLTQQLNYQTANRVSVNQLYSAHVATRNRFQGLLHIFRKMSASMQSSIAAIMRAMGSAGQMFLRGLSLAAEALGPIIAASVTVVSFVGSAALSAAMAAPRFMRWFWDRMVGLGDAMLEDWLAASGSMSSIGGLRAFRSTFGALFGDSSTPMAMAQANAASTSNQAIAMRLLGVRQQQDSADMSVAAIMAASRFMKAQPKGMQFQMAQAMALTSVFPPTLLAKYMDLNDEELQAIVKMYKDYAPLMQITDKAREGWIRFSLQVKAAELQIVAVIAEKLADKNSPFVQELNRLSKSVTHFVTSFLEAPAIKDLIKDLSNYLEQFAKKLDSEDFKTSVQKFMVDLEEIAKDVSRGIDYLTNIIRFWKGPTPFPVVQVFRPGIRRGGNRYSAVKDPKTGNILPFLARDLNTGKIVSNVTRDPSTGRMVPNIIGDPKTGKLIPNVVRDPQTGKMVTNVAAARPPSSIGTRDIQPATGELRGGRVNSSDLYNAYKQKFTGSALDGYVPKDGARWGITKGTPDEWARLATSVSKQESGLNANAPGGGLNQFEAGDLQRYGVSGAVNDPNAQTQALVNQWSTSIRKDGVISQPAPGNPGPGNSWLGAGRYFGSMRDQGWHGKTQADVDKYLGSNGWADRAQAAAQGAAISGGTPAATGPAAVSPDAMKAGTGQAPEAFIMHHTGGREASGEAVQREVEARGLGVEYVMERDGTIKQIGQPGAANIMPESRYRQTPILGEGKPFLTNKNIVGMEVIAKDDKDVTPAQVAAARKFIGEKYPNTPVFGHGEVNPGHKEADEGMTIVHAIRDDRQQKQKEQNVWPDPSETRIPKSFIEQTERQHPINNLKVDNRSDMDISKGKDTENADVDHSDTSEADSLAAGEAAL